MKESVHISSDYGRRVAKVFLTGKPEKGYGDNGLKRCPACGYLNHGNAYECERCPWEFGFEGGGTDSEPEVSLMT